MATATKKTPASSKSTMTTPATKTTAKKAVAVTKTTAKVPAATAVKKTVAKPVVAKVAVKKVATAKAAPAEVKPAKKAAVEVVKETAPTKKVVAVSPEHRYHMIATAAYFLAQGRGFAGGYEMQDWITAEHQIDAQLKP